MYSAAAVFPATTTLTPTLPQAVIFDMDGVLFDTERLARRLWVEVFAQHGYELPEALYKQAIGRTIADVLQLFADAYGDDLPIAEMDLAQEAQYADYISRPLPFKTGVRDLLDWLRAHAIRCAVASSTYHADVEAILARNDLRDYFDLVVGGDQVAASKPAPDIFLKAIEGLGACPDQSMVIEDSANGLRAANAAGAITVMVPDLISPAELPPDLCYTVYPTLSALKTTLATLPKV